MAWHRIDDGFPEHPKLQALEDDPRLWADALALWLAAGCYCRRASTGGFVSDERLKRLTPMSTRRARRVAQALVDETRRDPTDPESPGLWIRVEGGYRFHDWDDYGPAKGPDEESAEPVPGAERSRKWRENRRKKILERDRFTCGYCGVSVSSEDAHLDHIVPRKYGGKDTESNLTTACSTCNQEKGGRAPREWIRWRNDCGMPTLSGPLASRFGVTSRDESLSRTPVTNETDLRHESDVTHSRARAPAPGRDGYGLIRNGSGEPRRDHATEAEAGNARADAQPPLDPTQVAELYSEQWRERRQSAAPRVSHWDQRFEDVAALCEEQARMTGSTPRAVLEEFLRRFWASGRAKELGFKPGALRSEFSEIMSDAPDDAPTRHPDDDDPELGPLRAEYAEIAKRWEDEPGVLERKRELAQRIQAIEARRKRQPRPPSPPEARGQGASG